MHRLVDDGVFLLNTEGGAAIGADLFACLCVAQPEAEAVIAFGQAVALHLFAGDALIHHRLPEHLGVIRVGQGVGRKDDVVARRRAVDPDEGLELSAADAHVAVDLLECARHVEEGLTFGVLCDGDYALNLARRLEVVGQLIRIGRKYLHRLIDDGCFLFDPERGTAIRTELFHIVPTSGMDE
ncbi:hypothetical protein Tanf_05785 [Tannerella forsythia]|nr:hypothetical protein Tanf_05785 [Tannerella forsythia]